MSDPIFKFAVTEKVIEYCKETGENPNLLLPIKSTETDTGWDVRCANPDGVELRYGDYSIIPLGFRVFSPEGWWLKLVPRSSTFIKKNMNTLYGTIDEGYEGEVGFCVQFLSNRKGRSTYGNVDPWVCDNLYIPFGERIGQLIPVRREEMHVISVTNNEFDQLCVSRNTGRGGGFGSTG